jgi:Zn-finger nucleic acid-binding protein
MCPRCRVAMEAVVVGKTGLRECSKCEGLWLDATSFQEICEDRDKQAAVLGIASSKGPGEFNDWENVHYLPCPVCNGLMNRVQFAKCSHVIVDVCKAHGTWFDKDELRRIVEFIRAGGMVKAREMEIDELEHKRSEAKAAEMASSVEAINYAPPARYDGIDLAINAIRVAAEFLFKL